MDKITSLRDKCNEYAKYPTHDMFIAAKGAAVKGTPAALLLDRIASDVRNEMAAQRKDGYEVNAKEAYAWKRNLLLAEAGAAYLIHINALVVYTCEPYKSLAPPPQEVTRSGPRSPAVAVVAPEPETMTFEQIGARFPRTRLWLDKKLLVDSRLDQIMCARCKADDQKCSKQGSHRGCWTQPVSIKLLERVEHSLTRHTPKRERKRRRTEEEMRERVPIQHA